MQRSSALECCHEEIGGIWATRVLLEANIAARVAGGDQDAVNSVLASLGPLLARYVYQLCRNRSEAEDVVQEALMTVYMKLPQLRQPRHLKPWAFRIAKNIVLMRVRQSNAGNMRQIRLADDVEWRNNAVPPDSRAFLGEIRRVLIAAIRGLPDKYRTVVILRDIDGFSTAETAAMLHVSADTIKTRLHRAHAELRHKLRDYGVARSREPSRIGRIGLTPCSMK